MFEDSQSNNGCDAGFCHAEEATFADENFEVDEVEPSTRSEVGDCDVAPEIPEGPSRVLLTNYDEKDCLAILITKEMVGHANAVKEDSSKLESLKEKLIEVRRKIELTHVEVNYCEGLIQSSGSPIVIEDLRREIAERQGTLREDEARRDSLEEDVIILKRNLAYSESLLRSMTLRLLEDANLLETPEEHLHEEVDRCQDNDSERRSEISYGSNVSIDQLYRRAVDEEVQERSRELREAEENFERRHEVYEQEKRRFHQKLLEGTCALSETAFDLCYLEDTRERTRELGAAEDAFEEAFARMKKLGPNQWDQESGFITDEYDDVRDGYAMSREDGEVADVTDRLIHKWLENVPNAEVLSSGADAEDDTDDELREDDEEGLENCDIRSARMSDSVSCCDMSRGRKRIDRWRAIAGRER